MRILKRVVYIMGVMLVVGALVVIGTIIYRAVNYKSSRAAKSDGGPGFEALSVDVAPGAVVGEIELDGNRMAVHTTTNGQHEILIIDVRNGKLLGRVKLKENPVAQ